LVSPPLPIYIYSLKETRLHFRADAFAVACRTSKRGLTMIWVPRVEGVDTKLIKTSYSTAAGTSYITFDDALVPVENTLGEVDKGLQVVLR